MSNRRKLLVALGLGALSATIPALAQQPPKVWRVGFLSGNSHPALLDSGYLGVFLQEMRELGYVEGQNLIVESRFADGKFERFPDLMAELVRYKVDVIVIASTPAALAAKKATTTIPIVMASVTDPVGSGLVASLAYPEGNLTGLSLVGTDIIAKQLEMMVAAVPKLSRVALFLNPANPVNIPVLKNVQAAARSLGAIVLPIPAHTPEEIEQGFATMKRKHAGAVMIAPDALFGNQRLQIAELASRYRLPSIGLYRQYAEAGVLMSYGQEIADSYRRAATYVDKILKGAKPSELPIEQPTRFYLVINRKTANSLGLIIPQELLLRADEVIE